MVVVPQYDDLKKVRDRLKQDQQKLISEIKEKYSDFYEWATQNNIDFTDLSLHSANIAAAFVISIGGIANVEVALNKKNAIHAQQNNSNTKNQKKEIVPIQPHEFRGLNESERILLVWERYGPAIEASADKYQVDKRLILATIMLESMGNHRAIRHEPAIGDASYGLGQILYGTARGIGYQGTPEGLYDPETNIDLMARYHRRNMDVYGPNLSAEDLTIAYNAGAPYHTPHPGHMTKFSKWYTQARHLIT